MLANSLATELKECICAHDSASFRGLQIAFQVYMKMNQKYFAHGIALTALIFLSASCGSKVDDNLPDPGSFGQNPGEPFPKLGTLASFASMSGQNFSNTGSTVIYGNIGVMPGGQITGMNTVTMTGGTVHQGDGAATQAQSDSITAWNNISAVPCTQDLTGQNLGNRMLTPGVYCVNGSADLTGTLTLDAQGDHEAFFVFKITGNFSTGASSNVMLAGNAKVCNVYFQVGGSAQLGTSGNVTGSVFALSNISVGSGTHMNGKVVSRNGTVFLNNNEIYNNTCPWEQ